MAKSNRKAIKISKKDLKNKLVDIFSKELKEEKCSNSTILGIMEDNLYILDYISPKFAKDVSKVEFDYENICCGLNNEYYGKNKNMLNILGVQTLDNDFTFIGFQAGGDWELPIFFIIYYDGKDIRGYIPKEGNVYNKTTKQALGNDDDADEEYIKKYHPEIECPEEIYEIEIDCDVDKIIEDIKNRIIVI